MTQVPPYISPGLVGKACGITRKAARSLLRRAGILERIGGRWLVGESQLRERLPEVYERLYTHIILGPETTQTGPNVP